MEWDLLKGLPDEWVRDLLARSRRRRFARREVLFHEGDPAASLHLVAKGRVAIRVTTPLGDVATLDLLGAGSVLGEMALLAPGGVRSATAVALEPTETHTVDSTTFAELRREQPALTDVLVALLAARVRQLNDRLLEALYVPADVRLLRRILELADVYGADIPLTQEDLAGLAGATRATVNRVLAREAKAGAVSLGRGRLTIADRAALERRAR
ncbi:MAG: Crp/Fnr family transcriptional regulator [Actinomycetota bacterium]|nr:Crp/Fnr family transcriptional regulator [Actinomycetota bacterium]